MRVESLRFVFTGSLICAALFLSPAFGQQPDQSSQATPDQSSATEGSKTVPSRSLPGERPLSPEELRKKQIDAFDPLAKDDSNPSNANSGQTAPAGDTSRSVSQKPLPGSLAESNAAANPEGPQILDGDSNATEQQYNGPAVLSRSYTLTRPMTAKQVKWSWTVTGGQSYTVGLLTAAPIPVTTGTAATGTVPNSSSYGVMAGVSLHGRHIWRHDQIGVDYTGSYNKYTSVNAYNGANQSLTLDYSHMFSSHLQLNVVESASSLSQSGTLVNPLAEPGVTPANVNLAASPTVQPLDSITRQSTTQVSLTWQKTARLSFNYQVALFGVERTGFGLTGDSGYQGQTDMNYRLTRKMTVGVYYSYVTYVFAHHLSDSDTHTTGLIYSYALGKSIQIRTRAGISRVENKGLTEIAIDPAIAALVGTGYGIVDSYSRRYTSDLSGELIKDFGEKRTANISYAHGVAPGNGTILTSTQQVVSASYGMLLFRHYNVSLGMGRSTLSATLATNVQTVSDYANLGFARTLPHNMTGNLTFSYRTYSLTGLSNVQPQYVVSSTVSWGPGEGKLW